MIFKGTKALIVALAAIAILLLANSTQLPQYGDGATGTIIVLTLSLTAYLFMLLLAVPMAIRSFRRGETIREAAWLCASIGLPMACWLALIGWASLH